MVADNGTCDCGQSKSCFRLVLSAKPKASGPSLRASDLKIPNPRQEFSNIRQRGIHT